ncbi:MAG: hypothetical protein J0M12_03685 [Deltaproteobacteria bacterium]|nr:hypothetical protein [Deltaproteobacteria bacterium]
MPSLDTTRRESEPDTQSRFQNSSIPQLVEITRLDRNVPNSDAYQAQSVHSALLPALTRLADLKEQGALKLNYSERSCDLPLRLNVDEVTVEIAQRIGDWRVEARAEPDKISGIIAQLRRLGIESVAIYSPQPDPRAPHGFAWICAANYEDLKSITAPSAQTEIILLEGTLPQAANAVRPVLVGSAGGQSLVAKTE